MNKLILIAEDDDNTSALLVRYLTKEGFDPVRANNGCDALSIAQSRCPCLVILDLMMPGLDGWEVCEELRATTDVAILILSARQEEADRILGLNLGADDYVVKPFSPREVVARVHAILRRSAPITDAVDEVVAVGELSLNLSSHCVTVSGKPIALTASEFIVLNTLMRRAGRVYTRDEVLNALCTDGQLVVDRVVDVHVAGIRRKISAVSDQRGYITTVRGIGYRLDA